MDKMWIFIFGFWAGATAIVLLQLFFAICKEPLRTDKDFE